MRSRDPQRLLTTIRRATAGSLLVAAAGSGVVAVHLAGDHAGAVAATRGPQVPDDGGAQEQAPRPESQSRPEEQAQPRGDDAPAPRPHATRTTRSPAPAPAKRFRPVAPVQPSSGPAQSGTKGS
jgi:hypothetical protein